MPCPRRLMERPRGFGGGFDTTPEQQRGVTSTPPPKKKTCLGNFRCHLLFTLKEIIENRPCRLRGNNKAIC